MAFPGADTRLRPGTHFVGYREGPLALMAAIDLGFGPYVRAPIGWLAHRQRHLTPRRAASRGEGNRLVGMPSGSSDAMVEAVPFSPRRGEKVPEGRMRGLSSVACAQSNRQAI